MYFSSRIPSVLALSAIRHKVAFSVIELTLLTAFFAIYLVLSFFLILPSSFFCLVYLSSFFLSFFSFSVLSISRLIYDFYLSSPSFSFFLFFFLFFSSHCRLSIVASYFYRKGIKSILCLSHFPVMFI